MADTRVNLDTGISFAGVPGALPLSGPWPSLSGKLFAGYMLGSKYAAFSRDPTAIDKGALWDWSGKGRHLASLTEMAALVTDWYTPALPANSEPLTPFTTAQFLSGGSGSIVVLAKSVATARTVSLVKTTTDAADPWINFTLFPQTPAVRPSVTIGGSATTGANLTLTTELANVSLYGASYTQAKRDYWAKTGVAATKVGVDNVALGAFNTSTGALEFLDEGGTGSGQTFCYGFAFYNNTISQADFDSILLRQREFHAAIQSGVPV